MGIFDLKMASEKILFEVERFSKQHHISFCKP